MAKAKRTPEQREADLVIIADRLCRGDMLIEITKEINELRDYTLTPVTIRNDKLEIVKRWREEQTSKAKDYIITEMARLDKIQAEAMREWERSKGKKTTRSSKKISGKHDKDGDKLPDETHVELKTEDRLGDPNYLAAAFKCIDARIALLGLGAAPKMPKGPKGGASKVVYEYVSPHGKDSK